MSIWDVSAPCDLHPVPMFSAIAGSSVPLIVWETFEGLLLCLQGEGHVTNRDSEGVNRLFINCLPVLCEQNRT